MKADTKKSILACKHVLIADDEADIRSLIAAICEGMGCTSILEAADGNEAKSTLWERLGDLDLVVCDWNMPQFTGLDLLDWARDLRPDLPFVMITGINDVSGVVRAVSSGVSGYILKPFGPDRLEQKVLEILNP